jgi:hypothetical protein
LTGAILPIITAVLQSKAGKRMAISMKRKQAFAAAGNAAGKTPWQ